MHMDREQESYVHSRSAVESTIEDLISLLDGLDEDPDLEPNGDEEPDSDDEPSLGRPDGVVNQTVSPGGTNDWELDRADSEPSFASPERHPSTWGFGLDTRAHQLHWADGSRSDREQDAGDECEHDIDSEEAGVGSCDGNSSQLRWGQESRLGTVYDDGSEPSLGWPESAGAGFRRDRERVWLATQDGELEDGHDAEAVNEDGSDTGDNDNGIGDADGRDEQWSGFLDGALVV